eukprot:1340210-Rhodomonas_salina.1
MATGDRPLPATASCYRYFLLICATAVASTAARLAKAGTEERTYVVWRYGRRVEGRARLPTRAAGELGYLPTRCAVLAERRDVWREGGCGTDIA